jgi:hypothetical protein
MDIDFRRIGHVLSNRVNSRGCGKTWAIIISALALMDEEGNPVIIVGLDRTDAARMIHVAYHIASEGFDIERNQLTMLEKNKLKIVKRVYIFKSSEEVTPFEREHCPYFQDAEWVEDLKILSNKPYLNLPRV